MNFLYALCKHAWLIITLKHNGDGMPSQIPTATLLISVFIAFTLIEKHLQQSMTLDTLLTLSFIGTMYVFNLRNKVVGLIITIGIVTSIISIAATMLAGMCLEQTFMVSLVQNVMIFCCMINVIKSHHNWY